MSKVQPLKINPRHMNAIFPNLKTTHLDANYVPNHHMVHPITPSFSFF